MARNPSDYPSSGNILTKKDNFLRGNNTMRWHNACNTTGRELTERTRAWLFACKYFSSLICAYCYRTQPYLQTYTLWSVKKLVPCVIWQCHESTDEDYHLLYLHTAFLWEEHTVHPTRNTAGPWYDVDWSLQLEDPVSWAWMCLQKIFQSLNTVFIMCLKKIFQSLNTVFIMCLLQWL